MPRKPVTELRGGLSPRQRIWAAIRDRGGRELWCIDDIVDTTRINRELGGTVDAATTRTYVVCLQRAGIVQLAEIEPGPRGRKRYRLARDEGIEAPRVRKDGSRVTQGLAQEQMWRTLRMLGNGDTNARELAAHASSSTATVALRAAEDYLQTLATAGYLECTQRGHGTGRGGVPARYRLRPDRNTGPKPPMVCRTRVVFDPNLLAVVWAPAVTEEDADHGR
ncbi:hypothetical protein [Pseudothauera rhizosphaerae]|uniref:Uncharacterized protein n=1 Tax=Pseudothauera rhizosphaerae TaxID=2565932 RepID=A0A4S4AMU7_9RHOO|nr:hypothetical protein [Pseudothauera rhizosphaerae]THF60941.1 hypothetical protein E6O51_11980 [Pseudothauera rhizosphaerae]